jgi:hypothetical protein
LHDVEDVLSDSRNILQGLWSSSECVALQFRLDFVVLGANAQAEFGDEGGGVHRRMVFDRREHPRDALGKLLGCLPFRHSQPVPRLHGIRLADDIHLSDEAIPELHQFCTSWSAAILVTPLLDVAQVGLHELAVCGLLAKQLGHFQEDRSIPSLSWAKMLVLLSVTQQGLEVLSKLSGICSDRTRWVVDGDDRLWSGRCSSSVHHHRPISDGVDKLGHLLLREAHEGH